VIKEALVTQKSTNTNRKKRFLKSILHLIVLLYFGLVGLPELKGNEVYFPTTPALSPDGQKIAFSYEGDIWMVSASGGAAFRLTGMQGEETHPRFSPDGKWIAFSGRQDGNANIYIIPLEGGTIKQLTHHESNDIVDSWSWDSKYIYFYSSRYNSFTEYKIKPGGGTPERLFEHYFNTVHGVVQHPKTGTFFFTDTFESQSEAMRKRYKGEYNPDIKSYNLETKEFIVHTNYEGKDFWPTIDQKGNLYFVSDRFNNEYNLFLLKDKEPVQLTSFDSSIKAPQVSANGEKIVFEKDYRLYIYDVAQQQTKKIPLQLAGNDTLKTVQNFNVDGKITFFDVSPDGKKIAFSSRGELFISNIDGKLIRKLDTAPEGRVMEVKWLKDNKTIIFNQTVNGWLNFFKIQSNKNDKETRLTFNEANDRNIALNNDKSRAVYVSGRNKVCELDLTTFQSKTITEDELWGFYNDQPYFSPDNNYIIYTAYRNFEKDIFIHDLKSGKATNLTDSGISESAPSWSPDGKYIYFYSNRYQPDFPNGGNDTKIFRVPLEKFMKPFKSTELDKVFEEKESDPAKDKEKNNDKEKNKPKENEETKLTLPVISFDFNEIAKRWERISPGEGTQYNPFVFKDKDNDIVVYISNHDGTDFNMWKTTLKPFDPPETKKIEGTAGTNYIIKANDKYYSLANGKIGEVDLTQNKFTPINMNYTFQRNLRSEFNQMFDELWAGVEENYYDEKFHSSDWKKIREKYRDFLPFIQSRFNLRTLIGDMLGELNSSHLGFSSRGDEEKTFYSLKSMETGILFENQNPYAVKKVVIDSPADKKGVDIKPGDVLVAVNNYRIDPSIDREYYFIAPALDDELTLTFKRAEREFPVKLHPAAPFQFKQNLYDEWIRENQQRVDDRSNKRIAYIHMKNMGFSELNNFMVEMTTEALKRDALILDLRYNTGGNVHDAVLKFLTQRPYTLWKYREGRFAPQPNFAPAAKPIVLLINEQSLSDAEMTAAGFKELKLGKIIGTETYRWLIFTSGNSLVDESYFRLPSWGCYTLDQKDIESTGVSPDIPVKNTFKDREEGKDPQLDAAIDEILKQLK